MKVSVVISIKNRTKLFRRTLKLLNKQTMPKDAWELVVVDDMSDEDVRSTLDEYASNLNYQYIKMDSTLNDFPIYWGPALSNNVGFKAANGEVIIVTGPEILHKETNFEFAYESAMKNNIAFGHVLHSHKAFVSIIDQNPIIENYSFDQLFAMPTSRAMDITKNTFYWFICSVKKEHVMAVNGCDEEFMRGICGDDDDFVNRIDEFGAKRIHDFRMMGIHQDHSVEDSLDPKRIRRNNTWEKARISNTQYLEEWITIRNKDPIVNKNRDWGSDKLIINKTFHKAT